MLMITLSIDEDFEYILKNVEYVILQIKAIINCSGPHEIEKYTVMNIMVMKKAGRNENTKFL